jgi:hypothetical protein
LGKRCAGSAFRVFGGFRVIPDTFNLSFLALVVIRAEENTGVVCKGML